MNDTNCGTGMYRDTPDEKQIAKLEQKLAAAITDRDALASQVATLTAERDEIGEYLWPNQTGMPNKHRNILVAVETRERLLRTQNAALLADCVVMRGASNDAIAALERWFASKNPHPNDVGTALECLRHHATDHPGAPLIEAVRKAAEALQVASQTFAKYTKIHADKKTDEGHAKAIANHMLYSQMEQALAELEKFIP